MIPSRCAFTQYARVRRAPSARSTVTRNRTFWASVFEESTCLDRDDAVLVADVIERVAQPVRVEHGVEVRRYADHLSRRGLRRAVRG